MLILHILVFDNYHPLRSFHVHLLLGNFSSPSLVHMRVVIVYIGDLVHKFQILMYAAFDYLSDAAHVSKLVVEIGSLNGREPDA